MKLSEYVPLHVQTQWWAWIDLATDNFNTVLTKNLWNPHDYAPLEIENDSMIVYPDNFKHKGVFGRILL